VHDAFIVVFPANVGITYLELVLPVGFDILPVHFYGLVAISALLFVSHTEHVTKLVDRDANCVAAERRQVEGVASPPVPLNQGPLSDETIDEAAARRRLNIDRGC